MFMSYVFYVAGTGWEEEEEEQEVEEANKHTFGEEDDLTGKLCPLLPLLIALHPPQVEGDSLPQ